MKIRHIIYALVLPAIVALLTGCNTNGCLENRSSVPLAGFYSNLDSAKVTLDSVMIYGAGMPESDPLIAAGDRISQVYLPMRSTQEQTEWVLAYKWEYLDYPQLNDTITLDYTSQPYFVSDECGVIFKYHIQHVEYTRHLIDAVEITDSLVTNTDVERIKIYFRMAEEEPEQ